VAYAAVGGFNANTPATPGHVFQVTCGLNCTTFTWANKTGNLPDIPVDSIIANPNYPKQVFAGTDWGLYFTDDITVASPVWYRFDNGLPHSMIWDMQIDRGATALSVWTRGRGAYVWPLPSAPVVVPTPTPTPTPSCTGGANVALASNGASAVASSSHSSGSYPTSAVINGDRTGSGWGTASGGWNDGTRAAWDDWLEIDFPVAQTISQINVFTLQNDWMNGGEPGPATLASAEGILDFEVQTWDGSTWVTVPNGSITGNDKAMRTFTFAPITTSKIRVLVHNARNNWTRIVEVEAFCGS